MLFVALLNRYKYFKCLTTTFCTPKFYFVNMWSPRGIATPFIYLLSNTTKALHWKKKKNYVNVLILIGYFWLGMKVSNFQILGSKPSDFTNLSNSQYGGIIYPHLVSLLHEKIFHHYLKMSFRPSSFL